MTNPELRTYFHPDDPAGWLKPGESLMVDSLDWSWAFVWYKEIPDFLRYCAGSNGTVWSRWVRGQKDCPSETWTFLTGTVEKKYGYLKVTLKRNGKFIQRAVHVLMLETFIGPCPDGLQCRHLDDNPLNNQLDNLRWGTPQENANDMVEHDRQAKGECHGRAILTEEKVRMIRRRLAQGEFGTSLAAEYHVNKSTIYRIDRREIWGFVE